MNYKLAVKVLKEMDMDFMRLEGTLARVESEETRIILFKELREHRQAANKLLTHYLKVLARGAQNG